MINPELISESKKIPKPEDSDYDMETEDKEKEDDENPGGEDLPEEDETDYDMENDTDDPEDTDDESGDDDDVPADDSEYNMDDIDPEDETGDDDETDPENTDGEEPTEDDEGYDMDDTGDGEEDEQGTDGDDTGDDTDTDGDISADQQEDELKQLENEVFSDLTDGAKNIRDKELKSLFITMYNGISSMLIKINLVPKNEQNIQIMEFSVKKLSETRQQVYDYLINTYKVRTYTENLAMYYEFLAIIEKIHNLIDSYVKKQEKEEKR